MSSTKRNTGSVTTPRKRPENGPGTSSSETGSASPKTTSVAALVGSLMDGIHRERSTAQTAVVPSDSKKKIKARHEWLNDIISRWETASGVMITNDRIALLAKELDDRNYPQTIARLAEEWILRGDSIKYGRLTLAAFYPTVEQLESLNLNIDRDLARERAAGFADGYAAGRISAQDDMAQNIAYIELLSLTKRIRRYAHRMAALRQREREQDEKQRRLVEKQRQLANESAALQRESARIGRKLQEAVSGCCPTDRELITKAIARFK